MDGVFSGEGDAGGGCGIVSSALEPAGYSNSHKKGLVSRIDEGGICSSASCVTGSYQHQVCKDEWRDRGSLFSSILTEDGPACGSPAASGITSRPDSSLNCTVLISTSSGSIDRVRVKRYWTSSDSPSLPCVSRCLTGNFNRRDLPPDAHRFEVCSYQPQPRNGSRIFDTKRR